MTLARSNRNRTQLSRLQFVLPSNHLLDLRLNTAILLENGPVLQFFHSSACFARILGFKDDLQFFK